MFYLADDLKKSQCVKVASRLRPELGRMSVALGRRIFAALDSRKQTEE